LSGLLTLASNDSKLLACDPSTILTSAAKAAILRLPIAKELGYAYIIPYGKRAEFVLGYKGMVQLAIRTGQYHMINATEIYEGEEVIIDRLTGNVKLNGKRNGDGVIGYIAYFKLKNGFEKFVYMTRDETEAHARKFSASYQYGLKSGNKDSAWFTNFDDMGKKTVLRRLLSRYGLMSIEMQDDDAPPFIGQEDPRITGEQNIVLPSFDDVLEGEFHDPEPQEAQLPADVFAACVEAKLSENIHAAKNTLAKCTTGYETPEKAIAWMRAYRAFRDQGMNPDKAAAEANAGKMPL
jgi:phage RecT family recombinase